MSDKRTPEERAENYYSTVLSLATRGFSPSCFSWSERKEARGAIERAFLAGRTDFIKNDLPKLLEMAREMVPDDVCDIEVFKHSIPDIVAMAEKGEV